jgi:alkylation response protein AidB-like acyl-CoA dehydrogenase
LPSESSVYLVSGKDGYVNFELTDDQRAIKRTARELLASRYAPEVVRELAASDRGFTDSQWKELSELGWPGVIVPEEHGGLGLGALELAVIHEEIGYALAPSPLLSSLSAALLLKAAGKPEQKQRWLPQLASGEVKGTLAIWEQRSTQAPDRSELEPTDGHISITKFAVPDAASADIVIVSGADGRHFLVETSTQRVRIAPQRALDPTRKLYTVTLKGVPVEELNATEREHIDHAYASIVTALAAENVGIAQKALEMAVTYAKDRKQFGRPIGSYQAVSHRCAQMLLEVEGARSLCYWAGWALDHDPQTALRAASMAKAYASDAGYRVAASALQVHGGIGFTWEHDLHFFLKRARANGHAFGDARWHRERVAELSAL